MTLISSGDGATSFLNTTEYRPGSSSSLPKEWLASSWLSAISCLVGYMFGVSSNKHKKENVLQGNPMLSALSLLQEEAERTGLGGSAWEVVGR
jgi:hypothetical protein